MFSPDWKRSFCILGNTKDCKLFLQTIEFQFLLDLTRLSIREQRSRDLEHPIGYRLEITFEDSGSSTYVTSKESGFPLQMWKFQKWGLLQWIGLLRHFLIRNNFDCTASCGTGIEELSLSNTCFRGFGIPLARSLLISRYWSMYFGDEICGIWAKLD